MNEDPIHVIRGNLEEINALIAKQNQIVPTDLIFETIASAAGALPECAFFLTCPKFFNKDDDFDPESPILIFPYLSFKIEAATLQRYLRGNVREAAYGDYRAWKARQASATDHKFVAAFVATSPSDAQQHLVEAIAQLMESYFQIYEYSKLLSNSSASYYRLMSKRFGTTGLLDDLSLIEQTFDCEIRYVTKGSDGQFRCLRGGELAMFQTTYFRDNYTYSLKRGEATDCYMPGPPAIFFSLVPNAAVSLDAQLESGCVCIIGAGGGQVDASIVRFAAFCVGQREREDILSGQNAVIEQLNRLRRTFIEEIRAGALDAFSARKAYLQDNLGRFCRAMASALAAHSVTIRILDRFDGKLKTLTYFDKLGEYDPASPSADIPLAGYRNSLNAAVFKLRTPMQPARIDDVDRKDWPKDFVALGFEGPAMRRKETASEICIPIWSGENPIGILNIEGAARRGFARAELLVTTVAQHLGDLMGLVSDSMSLPTVLQIASISDAAHGAADIGDVVFDAADPTTVLSHPALVPALKKFSGFLKSYRSPTIRADGRRQAFDELVAEIRRSYERCLVPGISEPRPDAFVIEAELGTITSSLASALLRICDIVFKNAAIHGRIDRDEIHVSFDRHHLLQNRILFSLRYTSHEPIDPAVLDHYGIAPIPRDGSIRYGAFLLGYQIKALGGILDVDRTTYGGVAPTLKIDVSIPLEYEAP